jgi:hypothetical protein
MGFGACSSPRKPVYVTICSRLLVPLKASHSFDSCVATMAQYSSLVIFQNFPENTTLETTYPAPFSIITYNLRLGDALSKQRLYGWVATRWYQMVPFSARREPSPSSSRDKKVILLKVS